MQLNKIENLILDMDGVLWHGETPLPELPSFFEQLKGLGIRYVFATNNASKTPEQYVEKFGRFGVEIDPGQVMTSALATAMYLSTEYNPAETTIYAIGKAGIRQALEDQRFTVLDPADDATPSQIVVVSFNPEVTYAEFANATIHCRKHGATLIGSNPDQTFPSERGQVPGAGALLAFMATATGQTPQIIGKPYPTMFEQALRLLGENGAKSNTAMVGDRMTTDMEGAFRAGLGSMLVLSGVATEANVNSAARKPDHVFADIHSIVNALKKAR